MTVPVEWLSEHHRTGPDRHLTVSRWQEGLTIRFTLLEELPPLRMLLIRDNLTGHHGAELLCWRMARGIMPLYTPLGGSWLNMAGSIQRILTRRALWGQHPRTPHIGWLEVTARAWNQDPTPFEWGGARRAQRQRLRAPGRALPGDSVLVRWSSGFAGVELRLQVRAASLSGMAHALHDVVGRDIVQPTAPVSGRRAPCCDGPSAPGPPA